MHRGNFLKRETKLEGTRGYGVALTANARYEASSRKRGNSSEDSRKNEPKTQTRYHSPGKPKIRGRLAHRRNL